MQLQSSSSKLNETQAIQSWLVKQLSEQLSLEAKTIKVSEPLTRYGLDSIDAVTLVGDLEDWLDLELPSTLFWDHPTIEKSSEYLVENFNISSALSNLDTSEAEIETPSENVAQPITNSQKGLGGLWGRLTGT